MNILDHEICSQRVAERHRPGRRTVTVVIAGVEEVTVPEPRTGKALRKPWPSPSGAHASGCS
jgi:hypothetical protein